MRLILCILLLMTMLAPWLAPWSGAQPMDSFVVYCYLSSSSSYGLVEVSSSGAVLKTLLALPTSSYLSTAVMAEDNSSYRVLGYQSQLPGYIGYILDVSQSGISTTIASGPPLYRPLTMVRNCDGDWIILNQGQATTSTEVLRLRGNTVTTLSVAANLHPYAAALDKDSGQVLVRGQTRTAPYTYGYFRVDPTTGTVTGFAAYKTTTSIYYGAWEPIFEGCSGAFIDILYDATARAGTMIRVHPEIGILKFPTAFASATPHDLVAAGQRLLPTAFHALGRTMVSPFSSNIFHIGADGKSLGSSTLQGITPYGRSPLLRTGSRHLSWSMTTAPNDRTLHLSFPGEAGYRYAVAFSMTGVRPGPLLSDGREIPLIVDPLTLLCVNGGIKGVLENTLGVLDANGRARVDVKLNAFGSALKTLKFWGAALVLDLSASSDVAYIAGPILLEITH